MKKERLLFNRIKGLFMARKVDPAAAVRDAFGIASDECQSAFIKVEPYTTLANRRHTILEARRAVDRAHEDDSDATDIYKNVAAHADPTDFEPYTVADLDAHTAAIGTLTVAFEKQLAAFAAFSPIDDLRKAAADLHRATCESYSFAAQAYSNAAHCARTTALERKLQAAKDEFSADLFETRAARATAVESVNAKAKADAVRAKAAANVVLATELEQKAKTAETLAADMLGMAEAARVV